jgi:hypothetical protein
MFEDRKTKEKSEFCQNFAAQVQKMSSFLLTLSKFTPKDQTGENTESVVA